jgi:hypothetical protein
MEKAGAQSARPAVSSAAKTIVFQASVFLISFLILFSRRPDAILNAQFWAEDGKYWYADAYQFSWHCLFMPWAGYLHTVPRLVGLFALLFPFALAPLVMNLCALVFQILPVHLFLSSRFSQIPFGVRLLGSLLYLAVPNSYEIHANATNIQWHLALLGCMVLLALPATGRPWLIFDFGILLLLSIDSPLGFPLIPVAALVWWIRRDGKAVVSLVALIPGTVLQLAFMVLSHTRRDAPTGATLSRLAGILGGQIFFSSIFGVTTLLRFFLFGERPLLILAESIALIVGLMIVSYTARNAPVRLQLFLLFAALVLVLALLRPFVDPNSSSPQWELLQFPGLGNRYYFYPMLGFLASLIWMSGMAAPTSKGARYLALAILLLLPIGIYEDWRYPPYKETHFREAAAQFERAAPGTKITLPVNPTGWQMELVKK